MKEYKGEIVHFFGGIHEYIGELEQAGPDLPDPNVGAIDHCGGSCAVSLHPNGPGWYRILNPCIVMHGQKDGKPAAVIARMWGDSKDYQKFVDIYCPPDSLMEIRSLNKEGGLHKVYQEALTRVEHDRIVPASGADIRNITSAQQTKRDKRKNRMSPGRN